MGYTNTIQSQSRSPQNASIKMERTTSLHSSTSSGGPKDADDSFSIDSAGRNSLPGIAATMPQSPRSPVGTRHTDGTEALTSSVFGTPSTISTAPSTEADEGSADGTDSLLGLERATWGLNDALTPMLLPRNAIIQSSPAIGSSQSSEEAVSGEQPYHRRSRSWEQEQLRRHGHVRSWESSPVSPYPFSGHNSAHTAQAGAWEQVGTSQSRVASFRNSPGIQSHGFATGVGHPDIAWHQVHRSGNARHSHGHHMHLEPRPAPSYQQAPYGGFLGQRNTGYHTPGTHTPPRSKQQRSPVMTPQRSPTAPPTPVGTGSPSTAGPNPPRSSSEILKTLLRKKACLYEPETSRAIAFVTWLVGRELALEYGYFSRQQLQSGVHACVAKKIDDGTITRTKVNRCMQIILNSCFHYIIPRPDGSEENGEAYRGIFAAETSGNSSEIEALPPPWDDFAVDKDFILTAASRESTPANSPRLGSQQSKAADDGHGKRAVLLCFNENVRSFDDVWRCHNEFIRDTANGANLYLLDKEWRAFFGRDTKTTTAWGSAGTSAAVTKAEVDMSKLPDVLGRMGTDELSQFRTTWCAKRYEHDHDQCAFAHVEVNGGWLRRNPLEHSYRAEICSSVVGVTNAMISPFSFTVNKCEKGEECDFSHSIEELSYHPERYKRKMCLSDSSRGGMCPLGDICPNFHTAQNVPRGKRRASPDRRPHGSHRPSGYRGSQSHGPSTGKGSSSIIPDGPPMLYIDPAPVSSFEKHLGPPGLQSLFRRHSSVLADFIRHGDRCKCCYSNFGDCTGIGPMAQVHRIKHGHGLPSTTARTSQ